MLSFPTFVGWFNIQDGGSKDDTVDKAKAIEDVHVVQSPPGRASCQNNAARRHATGDIFLFLHADTILPPSFGRRVIQPHNKQERVETGMHSTSAPHLAVCFCGKHIIP